ncbi:MAG: gamma-glutamylcyclotransferase [Actinobacteria bacterium]|nr:gamma-glutamylcyclotransferase [Actinomycetota bacterium]
MSDSSLIIDHLFTYGTLQPGESRWQELAPFVGDEGIPACVAGRLYDTELDYPAAIFDDSSVTDLIHGRVYRLHCDRLAEALAHLDEVEGAVSGSYHRIAVRTLIGLQAWAYQCGEAALLLRRLPEGDWLRR